MSFTLSVIFKNCVELKFCEYSMLENSLLTGEVAFPKFMSTVFAQAELRAASAIAMASNAFLEGIVFLMRIKIKGCKEEVG